MISSPSLPPPLDIEAERRVLGHLLCDELPTSERERLRPGCFTVSAHAWLYSHLPEIIATEDWVERKNRIGELYRAHPGNEWDTRVLLDLQSLFWQPVRTPESRSADVELLIEIAKRRALCQRIAQVDIGLRCGLLSAKDALDYLRTATGAEAWMP